MGFDLIGDIHGEAPSLRALLTKLGYQETSCGFTHDENRIAIVIETNNNSDTTII